MTVEKADLYTEALPLYLEIPEKAWKGVVGFMSNDKGLEILRLTEDEVQAAIDGGEEINEATNLPYGMYKADCAEEMLKDMLFESFTSGTQINRWAVYMPDVADNMVKEDVVISNVKLQRAIDNMDELEVSLVAGGRKFKYPRLNLWAKGSKPTSNKARRRVVRAR
jgi:hypothetical protein